MKKSKKLIFNTEDLPLKIELRNERGQQRDYVLCLASRKFGASLQTPNLKSYPEK